MEDAYLLWYQAEIDRVPPLSRNEELNCVEQIRKADPLAESARERLFEAHLYLVVSLAKRLETDKVPVEDLISVGNQALLAALSTFIAGSEGSFTTQAATLIEQAIADAVTSPDLCGIPWTRYRPENAL